MKRSSKIHISIALLFGIGILGAVFYFPVNIDNQYTCLFHRLFSPDHSYVHSHTDIVEHYVTSFGFMWWGSLILLALSIYLWKRLIAVKVNPPQITRTSINHGIDQQ